MIGTLYIQRRRNGDVRVNPRGIRCDLCINSPGYWALATTVADGDGQYRVVGKMKHVRVWCSAEGMMIEGLEGYDTVMRYQEWYFVPDGRTAPK